MTAIATASVSGKVVDAAGRGIENATVSVHGYDSYNVQTDRDGNFTAEGVYRKGGYTIDAHALNYETASRSIESLDGDIDLGSFMLQEKLIAPANVAVESDRRTPVREEDATHRSCAKAFRRQPCAARHKEDLRHAASDCRGRCGRLPDKCC